MFLNAEVYWFLDKFSIHYESEVRFMLFSFSIIGNTEVLGEVLLAHSKRCVFVIRAITFSRPLEKLDAFCIANKIKQFALEVFFAEIIWQFRNEFPKLYSITDDGPVLKYHHVIALCLPNKSARAETWRR